MLAGIWQELLHVERVGRNDNFFELGGHSLVGMKMISAIRNSLGTTLPVSTIFQCPSLRQIAKTMELLEKISTKDLTEKEEECEEGTIELSSAALEQLSPAAPERADAATWQ